MAAPKMPSRYLSLLLRRSTILPQIQLSATRLPCHLRSLSSQYRPRNGETSRQPQCIISSPASLHSRRHFHCSRSLPRGRKLIREHDQASKDRSRQGPMARLEETRKAQDDYGILPGTAIVVTRKDWPSFEGQPRARTMMEWQLFKTRAIELLGRTMAKSFKGWGKFFKTHVRLRDSKQAAVLLHEKFNTATASGNLQGLKDTVLSSLYSELATSISQRPDGTTYRWELNGPQPLVTVISDRTAEVPKILKKDPDQDEYLRQAVVRIRSEQSLYRRTRREQGQGIQEEKVQGGEFDELLVIQKRMFAVDEDEEWRLWGTTEEVRVEDWEKTMKPDVGTPKDVSTPAP